MIIYIYIVAPLEARHSAIAHSAHGCQVAHNSNKIR